MPNSHYRKGRQAEYELRRILENSGFRVVRSAQSRGPCDLVAFNKAGKIRLIQVKAYNETRSFFPDIKEMQEWRLLYPHFSWELWLRKSGGEFERID